MNRVNDRLAVICPHCGSTEFKQRVNEGYYRYLGSKGEFINISSEVDREIIFGAIRCVNCEEDCSEGFESLNIE